MFFQGSLGARFSDVDSDQYWASYAFALGEKIRALRTMQGLSQAYLAERAGISRSLLSNLERNSYNRNRAADPTLSTIYRIAAALDVSPLQLLPADEEQVDEHDQSQESAEMSVESLPQ